jgi:phosphoglycolate phosphatase
MKPASQLRAVLFDLDGTLLDTAPDMVAALNRLCREESRPPVPYDLARDHVSNGALGLLRLAFDGASEGQEARFRNRFLEIYAGRLSSATTLFPGMDVILELLDRLSVAWGVVTNKPASLTEPLLEQLELLGRCACVVSGDTLPERKPHPRPLLHALEMIDIPTGQAVYIGDAARVIAAGKAAGIATVAATYGYIQPGEDPVDWGADHTIAEPGELLEFFRQRGVC